jgi:hypothetical protein
MAAAGILILWFGLSLATAQPPDPRPGATQPVREQNLDSSGAVRVHEQGTANVNLTNSSLNVGGTVSVSNFPATQNVFVTGGTLDSASLTPVAQAHVFDMQLEPGQSSGQITFNTTFNAVAVSAGSLREGGVTLYSPLNGGIPIFGFELGQDGSGGTQVESFAHPVPINGVSFTCSSNASDTCFVGVTIMTP